MDNNGMVIKNFLLSVPIKFLTIMAESWPLKSAIFKMSLLKDPGKTFNLLIQIETDGDKLQIAI